MGFDTAKLIDAIDHFLPSEMQPEVFGEYSCAEKMVGVLAERLWEEVRSKK